MVTGRARKVALLATMAVALGAAAAIAETAKPGVVEIGRDPANLPAPVREMLAGILEAVAAGDIEALRIPIEMNELPPAFGPGEIGDPVAHWQKISADGKGFEVLAILSLILDSSYARVKSAKGAGGEDMFVWPYLAATPFTNLTPRDEVELFRLAPRTDVARMKEKGCYDFWRLSISASGVWHTLDEGPAPGAAAGPCPKP